MKATLKYAMAVGITAAAMFAYMYDSPLEELFQEKAEQVGRSASNPPQSKAPEKTTLADESTASLKEKVANAETAREKEALIAAWVAEYGADYEKERSARIERDAQEYESFNVRLYNPVTTICGPVETVTKDGALEIQETCREEYEFPRHPFYALDNEALQTLAYSEPLAAFIIAERIGAEQPEAALGLLLHAAAISGKPGPLAFAAHDTFDFYRIKRKPTIADIEMHLALAEVALAMGGPDATTPLRVPDGIEVDQTRVKELARTLKSSMAQTQMSVTGSSSLKELFDV